MVTSGERFGIWLKNTRQRLGISQERLAKLTEIDRGHISKIENGYVNLPIYETRQKFHAALGTGEEELKERGIVVGDGGREPADEAPNADVTYVVRPPDDREQAELRKQCHSIIDRMHPLKLRWMLDQLERLDQTSLIGLGVQSVRSDPQASREQR